MDMDYEIVRVHGREILDSRGNPTVEAEVEFLPAHLRENMRPANFGTEAGDTLERE